MSPEDIEELETEFNLVNKDIEEVREKRDEHNAVTKDLISLIKETSQNVKNGLKKANEFRDKRDGFNEKVQEAKNNRITTQIALEELRKKLNNIKEKYKDLKPINKEQKIQIRKLQNAVKARNMEIETKPDLSLQEEDRLIKEIEELSFKLKDLTKGDEARQEYSKVIAQFPSYRNQLKNYHDEVIINSEESQKYHEKMIAEYNKIDEYRERIKQLEDELNKNRKIADDYHNKLIGLYKRRDELRDTIMTTQREMRIRKRKERSNVALLKRRIAKEKMEKGEKLDFIEFRLLAEKNELPDFPLKS
ncbi:MAG: coiled-coil protein [Candidatus Hodarchaeota archaeon]